MQQESPKAKSASDFEWIRSIEVLGYRGFGENQELCVAVPNGTAGSGVTVLVGPNSGGKTTLIETIHALFNHGEPSFTEGKRNQSNGGKVVLKMTNTSGKTRTLQTVSAGGSETKLDDLNVDPRTDRCLILPSRRHFDPDFSKGMADRRKYFQDYNLGVKRGDHMPNLSNRLFRIEQNRRDFDSLLSRVISPVPDWSIDQNDQGHYYIKVQTKGSSHSSEGLGDGFISLMFIIDALYDSSPGDIIVIDEPELSLHPFFQKNLSQVFREYAADRQIICATHSPYFIDWHAIAAGGMVARVCKPDGHCRVFHVSTESQERIHSFLSDTNNPHVLGLDASGIFFLEDGIILVEGPEDVIHYPKVLEQLNMQWSGTFFGWGVGGEKKMGMVAKLLEDMGFNRVIGILDQHAESTAARLRERFPKYRFDVIPADDVRTKPAQASKPAKEGLLDDNGNLRPETIERMRALGQSIADYLTPTQFCRAG